MKTTSELDINYYVNLASEKVGYVGNLRFQTTKNYLEKAGTFEILDFTPYEKPSFYFCSNCYRENDTPTGADLGVYRIRITDSKFYNGKTIRFKVVADVQSKKGMSDDLFIIEINEDTGKRLKAYTFPVLKD